jgi:hypothetical protein
MTILLLVVHEHTVPHGCAVGFPGGRTVSKVPLHYRRTAALGLSAVRRWGSIAVVAAAVCREQVGEDLETRSEDGLTSRHIARGCRHGLA